jgi:hypothetical protein
MCQGLFAYPTIAYFYTSIFPRFYPGLRLTTSWQNQINLLLLYKAPQNYFKIFLHLLFFLDKKRLQDKVILNISLAIIIIS